MDTKKIRESLNITQAELASATGIPRDRIAKWEQGKGRPKADDAEKIVNFIVNKVDDLPESEQAEIREHYKAKMKITNSHIEENARNISSEDLDDENKRNKYKNELEIRLKKIAQIKGINYDKFIEDVSPESIPGRTHQQGSLVSFTKLMWQYPDINLTWVLNGIGDIYNDLAPFSRLLEFLHKKKITNEEFYEKTNFREDFLDNPSELQPGEQLEIIKSYPISHTWLMTGIGAMEAAPSTVVTEKEAIFRLNLCISLVGTNEEISRELKYSSVKLEKELSNEAIGVYFVTLFCDNYPFNIDWILYGFGYMLQSSDTFLAKKCLANDINMIDLSSSDVKYLTHELDRYVEISNKLDSNDQKYFYARFIRDAYAFGFGNIGSFALLTEQLNSIMGKMKMAQDKLFSEINPLSDSLKFETYKEYRDYVFQKYNRLYKALPALNRFILHAQEFLTDIEDLTQ